MATSKIAVFPFPAQTSHLALELMAVENKQVKERSVALTSNSNLAKYLRFSAERVMENVSRKELIEDATLLFLGECKTVFRRSSRLFEMLKGTAQVKARASADHARRPAARFAVLDLENNQLGHLLKWQHRDDLHGNVPVNRPGRVRGDDYRLRREPDRHRVHAHHE